MNRCKPDVLFILSVDTEEEWDWSGEFPQEKFQLQNTGYIPDFQAFCERLDIRPTYMVDYAVADHVDSVNFLKASVDDNKCEIGAHLHPWCNPPYYGVTKDEQSHVINLPIDQVERKLDALIHIIQANFGVIPTTFRTGRWGINGEVLSLLIRKGFNVDSSMYPYFRNDYFSCENTPLEPYWPDLDNPEQYGRQRNILQIPVSAGFNHRYFSLLENLYKKLHQPIWFKLRLIGIFWQLHLMRMIYLSPELFTGADMISLVRSLLKNELPVVHMYLHSSSFIDGKTGLMNSENSCELICKRIGHVIDYLNANANVQFCTLSEASVLLHNRSIKS